MKRILTLLIITLLLVAPVVVSQPPALRPRIRTMVTLGKGIAVSKEDATDFEIVKLGIAKVRVGLTNESLEMSIGVLWVGEERYKVKDIVVSNDTIEANIYSGDEVVGTIAITSIVKQYETVWAGELEINDKQYNVYILEGARRFRPGELGEGLADYCGRYPMKCVQIAKGIATQYCTPEEAQTESCRKKIVEYCKDHPDDQRCIALKRAYCVLHPEDMRCRMELRKFCALNPADEKCVKFCELHPLACGKKSRAVLARVKERAREMLRRGIQQAREKIRQHRQVGGVAPVPPVPPPEMGQPKGKVG